MLTASELHRRAVDESAAGRYGRARVLLSRALARAESGDLTARILVSLADAESERGSLADGLALCDRALAVPDVGPAVRGLIHAQQALLLMRSGDSAKALAKFDLALPQLLSAGDPVQLARFYLNRGNVYLQAGDLVRSRLDLERCLRLGPAVEGSVLQAKAEHNLGYVYLLSGDLVSALRRMDSARPTLGPLSTVSSAIGAQDRAEVMVSAGLVVDAAETLRHAATAFGTRRLRQRQGQAELALARLLMVSGDFPEARRVARRAGRRFAGRGSTAWNLRANLVALSCDVELGRIGADTATRAATLSRSLRTHGLKDDALAASLQAARCAVRTGESRTVRSLDGLRLGPSAPIAIRLLNRQARAEIAAARGRRGDALRHVRGGLEDLHAWQSSFGSLDLQTSLFGHGQALAGLGLSMAVEDGRPAVVFEWFERARALASRVAPVRPPADASAADALAELRRLQLDLRQAEPGAGRTELTRRANRLREQIRQRSWYDAGADTVIEPATLEQVGAAVAARDGALISYVVVEDAIHAVVVNERTAQVYALGRLQPVRELLDGLQADLDVAASQLPRQLRIVVLNGLRQRLARLSGLLWRPLAAVVGGRPVVIVPPGALVTVPWSLLPGLEERPVTVARSASSWLRTRDRPTPLRAGLVSGPNVPRAEEEVLQAAKAWEDVRVLTGADAVAADVSALAADVDVLHVASHGRHAADNPLFSGLELVDGPWFGYDIDRLPRVPATVVLSACELGRSAVRWGAETIGMTVAWLHAGTSCVIASPARVDDDVACDVLARTHKAMAGGRPPADALAEARGHADPDAVVPFLSFGAGW